MDPLGHRAVPSPALVERQMAEFWRKASTDEKAVMRACSMNLVTVCTDEAEDVERVTGQMARVAETVPGRALVVGSAGAPEGLDVYVSAHCHRGPGGAQVCSEQVTLTVGRSGFDLVPGTVLQLLVEDMPVYTWWRRTELDDHPWLEPLLDLSDYWVLDSATCRHPAQHLQALAALAARESWRGLVVDAAWARLEPWREAIASFFDNPSLRPALERITRISVAGAGPVAFAYFAGWLASRLGLRPAGRRGELRRTDGSSVQFEFVEAPVVQPGRAASVRMEAGRDGETIFFDVRLADVNDDRLRLSAFAEGHRLEPRTIKLPARDQCALLCGLLQQTGPDRVYREALDAAAAMVRRA
jgi:glucose-6-phosphate dehydrogenase assembly protein OpcA